MNRIPTLAFSLALALSAGEFDAHAQSNTAAAVTSNATSTLSTTISSPRPISAPPSRSIPAASLNRKPRPRISAIMRISWW
jgi:hypothetical protein